MINWVEVNEEGYVVKIGKTIDKPQSAICIDETGISESDILNYKYKDGNFVRCERKLGITWEQTRQQRDNLLRQTDWTQLADAQLTAEEKESYRQYRQFLRDIPQMFIDPNKVVWPTLES